VTAGFGRQGLILLFLLLPLLSDLLN
jgi:hypothetical protein